MTHSRWFLLELLGSVGLLVSTSGCSLIFVKTAPSPGSPAVTRSSSCTSSPLAPLIDTGIGGFQVVRTAMAAEADASVYHDPKQPLSRGADIGLGLGLTALFLGSALYGIVNVNQCANRESEHEDEGARGDEDETPAEGGAAERWQTPPFRGGRPPSARPPSARPPSARPPSARPAPRAPAAPAETKPVEPIPTVLEEDPSPSPDAPPTSP